MALLTVKRRDVWGIIAALACVVLLCAFLFCDTVKTIKMKNGSIVVKGYAQKRLTSDYACWQMRLSVRDADLVQAYSQLESQRLKVFVFLKEAGILEALIKPAPVQTELLHKRTESGHLTNEIEAFELSQQYYVSTPDVALIESVCQQVSCLIKDDMQITSYAPQYFYSRLDELKIAMLGEAAKDAQLRAKKLTEPSGAKVGSLLSAHQGVFQITPLYSNVSSDSGENDTASIEKTIKAIVTMEYSLFR